jgi:hypothetical protein
VLTVEARFIEAFQKVSFARNIDRGVAELVNQARNRLAEAADCPPEMLRGLGSTNRWNGGQIADDEYRRFFKPKAEALADGWTTALLWTDLAARGFTPEQYRMLRVLVDSRGVVADPDYTKIAPLALDRGAIGPKGFRRLLSIPEWAAPTPEELAWIEKMRGRTRVGGGQGDTGPSEGNPVDESKGHVSTPGDIPVDRLVASAGADDLSMRLLAIERTARVRRARPPLTAPSRRPGPGCATGLAGPGARPWPSRRAPT